MSTVIVARAAGSPAAPTRSRSHATLDAALAWTLRAAGALVVVTTLVPFYLLLEGRPETGIAGAATAQRAREGAAVLWTGFVICCAVGVLAARFLPWAALSPALRNLRRALLRPGPLPFAAALAGAACLLAAAYAFFVLEGATTLIDAQSQLVHARYLAAGFLAGPADPDLQFWMLQNTLIVDGAWVSQYPPGHLAIQALAMRAGAVWLVGPISAAATVFFTALALEKLLPARRIEIRVAALATALSPFLLGQAAAYMSHAPAAALAALTLYAALRARQATAWALLAGAAAAAMFAVRPLHGLVIAAALLGAAWLLPPGRIQAIARRSLLAAVGAAPILAAVALYNARLFGSALRFGYEAAQGPGQRLGFHRDPWGNLYGLREALAFSSADLASLNLKLLDAPLPLALMAGGFLMLARRLSAGERVLAAWALLPVLANVFYWHHGDYLGPRFLSEAAPAWIALGCIALFALARRAPAEARFGEVRFAPRTAVLVAGSAALLIGAVLLLPPSLQEQRRAALATRAPDAPPGSIVFVHGSWSARVGARLAAEGMRLDVVEAALRQNATCALQQYLDAPPAARPRLDLEPRAVGLPRRVATPAGDVLRVDDAPVSASCRREYAADRAGIVDVAPMFWRAALPGLAGELPLLVRDFGPERNAAMLRRYPALRPLVLVRDGTDGTPLLVPYDDAMRVLWSGDA